MNWIYSIIFAGFLLSGDAETPVNTEEIFEDRLVAASVQDDVTEKFQQTYPLTPNGRVAVSNVNGQIVIEAWDRNEVRLEATKVADSAESLADVELKIDSRPDSFSVKTDYRDWRYSGRERDRHRKIEVHFKLSVPRGAALNQIEAVNGSVTLSNFTNISKVSAVNGNVNAANLRGNASLSTVNGTVNADFEQLERGTQISLNTVNGRVNVSLPSDVNATVKAESLNGSISNEFGLSVKKGKYIGRNLHGRLGSGEVQVRLNSVNGGLAIQRRKDGRSLSPATDLVPKDNDNDPDDLDTAAVVDAEKVNKTVSKAIKETDKIAKEALKAATVELSQLETLGSVETTKALISKQVNESFRQQAEALAKFRVATWPGAIPTIEKKSRTFEVKGTPKVTIVAEGCSLSIRSWDRSEVRYVVTEVMNGGRSSPAEISDKQSGSEIEISVSGDTPRPRLLNGVQRLRLEVFVPRVSNLNITADGDVRLTGVSGEIILDGAEGNIDVREGSGSLALSIGDARARIIGFDGEVEFETGNGEIFLDGGFKGIRGRADNAQVYLTLPDNLNAKVVSDSRIIYEGPNPLSSDGKELQIGKGGPTYRFEFAQGKLIVRNSSILEVN